MRIGIISDIHGYPTKLKKAVELLGNCDIILCAGDILYHGPRNPILEGYSPMELAEYIQDSRIPMLSSKGNCDAEVDAMVLNVPFFNPSVLYERDGIRLMVLHGHDFDDEELQEMSGVYHIDIMITGHTHVRKCEVHNGTYYINPGSISLPKGDGIPSAAVFDGETISFINAETGDEIESFEYNTQNQ